MNKKNTASLVLSNILLLIPLIIYGVYKNGYLLYLKNLVDGYMLFKPLYLVLISIFIKIIIDLIISHKVKLDYNLVYVIIVGMIMPYHVNLLVYTITFLVSYLIYILLKKHLKFNGVCFIYLMIILVTYLMHDLNFLSPLEENFAFSFSSFDYLMGRVSGGISSTCIISSLLSFMYLSYTFYYKKDIPLFINLTYLLASFIYFLITKNTYLLLNSEVIFGSIFVSTLPEFSPYTKKKQILYGVLVGILTFILSLTINKYIGIYLALFLTSFKIIRLHSTNVVKTSPLP